MKYPAEAIANGAKKIATLESVLLGTP